MKLNITSYELWFWRVTVIITLLLSLTNYNDNRQQDKLIFKTIDNAVETQEIIRSLIETDTMIINDLTDIVTELSYKD